MRPTLIFDEVDVGVGGRLGQVLGEKLWQLANRHQILCVTHLPQLAAYGDHHVLVSKSEVAGRTETAVRPLAAADREEEIAAMLGSVGEAARLSARELLARAGSWKNGGASNHTGGPHVAPSSQDAAADRPAPARRRGKPQAASRTPA
jgi:DNA repair protein RecN (Recombination protein N)